MRAFDMPGFERFVTERPHRLHRLSLAATIARMRRTLTATAALATLLLAGCSSAPSDTDKKYAAVVQAVDEADFGGIDIDTLASTLGTEGPDICDQLKKGTYLDAMAYAKLGGRSDREAEALVAAAPPWYCPNQESKLPKG